MEFSLYGRCTGRQTGIERMKLILLLFLQMGKKRHFAGLKGSLQLRA
jgi:hypothetical protein